MAGVGRVFRGESPSRREACQAWHRGYRTFRVAGRVTFWLSGAGKSVFSLVGAHYEDGHCVLLEGWLFGFLVRKSHFFSWCMWSCCRVGAVCAR